MKKIISILLCMLMAVSLFSSINTVKANADTQTTLETDEITEAPMYLSELKSALEPEADKDYVGFQKVAETKKLAMYVIESTVNIAILNKETGMVWSSLVKESAINKYGEKITEGKFHSILSVGFTGVGAVDAGSALTEKYSNDILTMNEQSGGGHFSYMKVDYASVPNGVRITAWYSDHKYKIIIDFSLNPENETMDVHCDTREFIYQSDRSKWVTLNVMPYFGAGMDHENGYVFIPDGSGSIAEFTQHHSMKEEKQSMMFFSPELASAGIISSNQANGVMPVLFPVFGMKRNNDAMFGVVTEGSVYSGVRFEPSGHITHFYRVHPVLYLKNLRPSVVGVYETESGTDDPFTYKYEGEIFRDDYHIVYYFLNGDDANYSGMARTYREYLIENDLLNDVIADGDSMPFALDLPMNTYESSIFGDKTVTMSTFSQASEIVKSLYDSGIKDMMINVSMWQKNGLSQSTVNSAASEIGGNGGFKNFVKQAKDFGYDVFAEVDMVRATASTTKFKASRDAAKANNGIAISGEYFLIAPPIIQSRYEEIYKPYMQDLGVSGMNFQVLGYYIYYYHYLETGYNKFNSEDLYKSVLDSVNNDFTKSATWYGNEYTLKTIDWIYDLPSTDTGYAGTTREVPFAQLVLHGYIPYSAIAGNTFYDDTVQTLKWIEYGYIPYYKITYESTDKLLETSMNILFSAKFDDWSETMVKKYNMMVDEVGYLYSVPMVSHEKLDNKVFLVTYKDGSKIFVNYDSVEHTYGDVTVPAKDFFVVKG